MRNLLFRNVDRDESYEKLGRCEVFIIARFKLRHDDVTQFAVEDEQFEQVAFGDRDLGA